MGLAQQKDLSAHWSDSLGCHFVTVWQVVQQSYARLCCKNTEDILSLVLISSCVCGLLVVMVMMITT